MNWGAPGYLVLGVAVAALAVLVAAGGWRHRVVLGRLFAGELLERVLPKSVRRRRLYRDVARLLAVGLVVVALAEPRFDKQIRTVTSTGADIVLVVDLSRSMGATDVDPSRLERARREVADLGRILQGDRVGLVIFSGGAYLRLPLTEDIVALQNVLAAADTSTFQANGSALGLAIDEGVEALGRSESSAGKALLVLSDGEIHDPDAAREAADRAAAAGVRIYAMGIGIEAAPVPDGKGNLLRHQGKVVQSVPEFTLLQQLAERTGGAFVQSVASSRDIESLYGGAIRNTLVAVERQSRQRETWRAAFQYPLGLALLLWLGGAWLGEGRSRRFGMAGAALLAVGLSLPAGALAVTLEEADELYRNQHYPQAAEAFEELSLEKPTDADVYDRLGASRYRAGDFDGAERAFQEASRLRGGDPLADFNAGNAAYKAGRLEEAMKLYEQASDLPAAEANRELVEQALQARRQQQPPPPPQGGEDQEQEGDPQSGQGSDDSDPQEGDGEGDQQEQGSGEGEDSEQDSSEQQQGSPQQGADQSGSSDSNSDGSADAGQQGSDDQQPDEGADSAPVSPEDLEEQGEGEQGEATQGASGGGVEGEDQGPITQGQAERLLDSVEEGSQRIYVRGRGEDKPW